MNYELLGSETVQGSDTSGTQTYELTVRNEHGVLTDIDTTVDAVTWTIVEDNGTVLTGQISSQQRVSAGRYEVIVSWTTSEVKPFYWTVKAAFTYQSAAIEFEFVTNFHKVAEADLVLVDGLDCYTLGWRRVLADLWAALRGPSDGTETVQTHEYPDGSSAFTVTAASDGDRTYT